MMAAIDASNEQRLTPKGRATRERIVEAAAELILTDGYSAFNLDGVRRTASVSGSQLAHYFADRQALIRAVLGRQGRPGLTQAMSRTGDAGRLAGLETSCRTTPSPSASRAPLQRKQDRRSEWPR